MFSCKHRTASLTKRDTKRSCRSSVESLKQLFSTKKIKIMEIKGKFRSVDENFNKICVFFIGKKLGSAFVLFFENRNVFFFLNN